MKLKKHLLPSPITVGLTLGGITAAQADSTPVVDKETMQSLESSGSKVIYSGEDFVVIANDTLPPEVTLNPNHSSSRTTIGGEYTTMKIGDPSPVFPGGRVCGEDYIRKAQATKLLEQELGMPLNKAIAKHGAKAVIEKLARYVLKLISKAAGILILPLSIAKEETDRWWLRQLYSVATGKKSYIRKQIICNYGGGYPAAWTRIGVR